MTVRADQATTERLAEGLVEFADALDKDRGHGKSYVTLLMREAAAELVSVRQTNEELHEALRAYEAAVQVALERAPNHWQRYRDPFELGLAIRAARRLGRAALAGSGDGQEPADTTTFRGCAQPKSAERAGAVNAKDNPSATDDGGASTDLTDRQPLSSCRAGGLAPAPVSTDTEEDA